MHDVFVSYAREDDEFVTRLCAALRRRDLDVWVDIDGQYFGEEFWPRICAGIDESKCFCFVVSPHSAASEFCRRELEYAASGSKRIVPVSLDDPNQALPEAAADRQWLWFRETEDFDATVDKLLASFSHDQAHVDAHTSLRVAALKWGDGKRDKSFLLRGRALDDAESWLADSPGKDPAPSELHRSFVLASRRASSRRLRLMLSGVTVALAVTTAAAVIAWQQRSLALKRLHDAVGVSNHIVTVLDSSLEDVAGAADVRDDLLEKSVELLDGLQSGARDATVIRVARAASRIARGSLAATHGETPHALAAYREAVAIREALVAERPDDVDRLRALSRAHERVGETELSDGRVAEARAAFTDAMAITERLLASNPDDEALRSDLSYSHIDLGDLARKSGNRQTAREAFERAVQLRKELVEATPNSVNRLRELSRAYSRVSDLALDEGRLDDALDANQNDTLIAEKVLTLRPESAKFRLEFAISLDTLGRIATHMKSYDVAATAYARSLNIKQKLSDAEPDNTEWLRNLSVTHNQLADSLWRAGQHARALRHLELDLTIARRLVRLDDTAQARGDLFASHYQLGKFAAQIAGRRLIRGTPPTAVSEYATAHTHLAAAAKIAQEFSDDGAPSGRWLRALANCYEKLGDLEFTAARDREALARYETARNHFQALVEGDDDKQSWGDLVRIQSELALSHQALRDFAAAGRELRIAESVLERYALEELWQDKFEQERMRIVLESVRAEQARSGGGA